MNDIRNLSLGVNAGIGPSRTDHADLCIFEHADHALQLALDRAVIFLHLPAVKIGAVVLDEKFVVQGGCQKSDVTGVIGHWSLVIGHWSLVIGHWSLVIGHWSLVIGHWSLVIGHWSLVIAPEVRLPFDSPFTTYHLPLTAHTRLPGLYATSPLRTHWTYIRVERGDIHLNQRHTRHADIGRSV